MGGGGASTESTSKFPAVVSLYSSLENNNKVHALNVFLFSLFVLFLYQTNQIVIYQDSNFGGPSREPTSDVSDLSSVGFNDRVSSIKVIGSV